MDVVFYDRKNKKEVTNNQLIPIKYVESTVVADAEQAKQPSADQLFVKEVVMGSIGYKSDKCPNRNNWDMWLKENDLIFLRLEK